MANPNQEPVVLDLAPPPRDQVGPFFLLGLEKDAAPEQIEEHWARRVIWARKGMIRVPLEDVNWARELINDRDRRPRADASSLNVDLGEGVLRRLQRRYEGARATDSRRPSWHPLDREKDLHDYTPPADVPRVEEIKAAIALPEIPAEMPVVPALLAQLTGAPLDPWDLNLPASDAR